MIGLAITLLASVVSTAQQQVTVKRNVNLRGDPSTDNPPAQLIVAGSVLELVDPKTESGYYHVKTGDGSEGWVWAKNVKKSASTSGTGSTATSASGADTSAVSSTGCDASLWDHVYNPERLLVRNKCITVTGTIVDATHGTKHDGMRHEADGDTHGWLKLDSEFDSLLNAGNMSDEDGNMVFEVVCRFHVTQADAKTACASFTNPVTIPPVGSHVRMVGSYVQDTNHAKWMEIHPVTSISVE
jgi:uncharacterized protein YgiM (DUF1202 family)